LKEPPGGGTSKYFEVCNNLPLDKILNFDIKSKESFEKTVIMKVGEYYGRQKF